MTNPRFLSPLRYPGGKRKLIPLIKDIIINNGLYKLDYYVEPFAGGSAVALSLLMDGYASKVIINDYDLSIYAFWYSVLNHTEDLCKKIYETDVTIEEWFRQKNIQQEKDSVSLFDLGFSTFFLNRTNRSGILKGGVMGGKKQLGKYKLDCRYNKLGLIKRIEQIALYRDGIILYQKDAVDLINTISSSLSPNTFYYFDPPYYNKGPELYENHYNHTNHAELTETISNMLNKQYWVVTYDNTDEICALYSKYNQLFYSLHYTAASKYKGSEVLIPCDRISLYQGQLVRYNSIHII